jgi:hypothetical protein
MSMPVSERPSRDPERGKLVTGEVGVSIHQPNFAPWSKFMAKIAASDAYVVFDTVQYSKPELHSRQRVMGSNGQPAWLSANIRHSHGPSEGRRQMLHEVELVEGQEWRDKNLNLLKESYRGTPFYADFFPKLEAIYKGDYHMLVDFNLGLIETLLDYLGEKPVQVRRATEFPHSKEGSNTEQVIYLTKEAGGNAHLTSTYGTAHDNYIDWKQVADAEISVYSQEFEQPQYRQHRVPKGEFVPNLSVIDLLFNTGPEASQILRDSGHFNRVLPQDNLDISPNN